VVSYKIKYSNEFTCKGQEITTNEYNSRGQHIVSAVGTIGLIVIIVKEVCCHFLCVLLNTIEHTSANSHHYAV